MSSVATISAVAAVGGAMISSNAQSKAASGAQNAAKDANQLQWNMFQQQQNNQAPWLNTGSSAVNQLAMMLGLNSQQNFDAQKYIQDNPYTFASWRDGIEPIKNTADSAYQDYLARFGQNGNNAYFNQPAGFGSMTKDFSYGDFAADPGLQFRLEQGAKVLERSGAAKGMSLSGAQLKGLTDYNSGAASQEYGNAYSRFMNNRSTKFNELASLAGLGQTANGQLGQMGMATSQTMGNNLIGASNMSGAAGLQGANAWTGALNSGANAWMDYVKGQQAQANKIG